MTLCAVSSCCKGLNKGCNRMMVLSGSYTSSICKGPAKFSQQILGRRHWSASGLAAKHTSAEQSKEHQVVVGGLHTDHKSLGHML